MKTPRSFLRQPSLYFHQPAIADIKPVSDDDLSRVHPGIQGLDKAMEGGFLTNTVNLVGGGAGSGKSIFCMQYLVHGIEQCHEPGVYISFEESERKILKNFKRFGWNLEKKIKDKKLALLYYTPEQVEKVIQVGGGPVRDVLESMGAKRLIIDSLTAFTLLHENELAQRRACLKLFEAIHTWGVTAVVTAEQEPDPVQHRSTVMEFAVDGVILLYNIRKEDRRERSLEIFKGRGIAHSAKIYPFAIGEKGIVVYPEKSIF